MSLGMLDGASKEEIRQLKSDPRKYVASFWRHPNDPSRRYDFRTTDGDQTLDYLLDDDGPLNPYSWGSINVLLMARGCLKTTTMLAIETWQKQFYGPHGHETYMTAPREGQVHEFVDKFREKVQQTGLDDYRTPNGDSYGHQQFRFAGDGISVTSSFKTDTGWGEGDALRGPHSHFGIVDEVQDLSERSFQVFRECIDQELRDVPFYPAIFLIGTPKLEGSFFHEMWKKSDQRDWDADASTWTAQSSPTTYGEGDEAMEIRGWHIDQPSCPLFSDAEVASKRDTKGEMEFRNEVLAEFYSPEDDLLAERHVTAIEDPSLGEYPTRRYDDSHVTVGVDWGGGDDRNAADTVLVVGEHVASDEGDDHTYVRRVSFVDGDLTQDEEFDAIESVIETFDPDRVVVDEGYGSKRRQDLQMGNGTAVEGGYGDLVVGVRFGNVSDAEKTKWKDSTERRLATVDKTHKAKQFVSRVKAEQLTVPAADLSYAHTSDKGRRLRDQLTATHEVQKETSSGRKKSRVTSKSGANDDAFDAFVYMMVGYYDDKIGPTDTYVDFGSSRRGAI